VLPVPGEQESVFAALAAVPAIVREKLEISDGE
jgi:hypothetical protein